MGLCKNCNQLGHYQKTCPLLHTNVTGVDADGNPIVDDQAESSSIPKPKKSKHPKFMSNQGTLPLHSYNDASVSAASYIQNQMTSKLSAFVSSLL
jgi:hypothetical protein